MKRRNFSTECFERDSKKQKKRKVLLESAAVKRNLLENSFRGSMIEGDKSVSRKGEHR